MLPYSFDQDITCVGDSLLADVVNGALLIDARLLDGGQASAAAGRLEMALCQHGAD